MRCTESGGIINAHAQYCKLLLMQIDSIIIKLAPTVYANVYIAKYRCVYIPLKELKEHYKISVFLL